MSKGSKLILALLFLLITLSVCALFYKSLVIQDFEITSYPDEELPTIEESSEI